MSKAPIWLLLTVLCLGCSDPLMSLAKNKQRTEEARRQVVVEKMKLLGSAMHANYNAPQDAVLTVTHEVVSESEYYSTSPQQGRPADGMIAAGTKVGIINDAEEDYVLVRSPDGVEGYITSDALTVLPEYWSDVDN